MKFAVFALIAGLCLVAVAANATGDFMTNNEEVEDYGYISQDSAEEIMEIEQSSIFFGVFSAFKKALRTLKGLNCIIKEVLQIENVTLTFVNNVHACGGEVSKKVQTLINACNDIINTCKAILGINESVCGNTVDEDDTAVKPLGAVSGAKNGHKCFVQILRKLQTLKKQIKRALNLIAQIKKVPADTNKCIIDAVNTLESYFTQFPANIKSCSKLTT